MPGNLLNRNQRRHVATHLQLLIEDLRELAALPELSAETPGPRAIHGALREVDCAARRLGGALGLPMERERDVRRRIGATADVWAMRSYELEPRALGAYGQVHPQLGPLLTPLVAELRHRLLVLSELAARAATSW